MGGRNVCGKKKQFLPQHQQHIFFCHFTPFSPLLSSPFPFLPLFLTCVKIKINRFHKTIQSHSNQQIHNSRESKHTKHIIIHTVSKVGEIGGEDAKEEVAEGRTTDKTEEDSGIENHFGVLREGGERGGRGEE